MDCAISNCLCAVLLAVLGDTTLSPPVFALVGLTALVVATLGVVVIGEQQRRHLPFVREAARLQQARVRNPCSRESVAKKGEPS